MKEQSTAYLLITCLPGEGRGNIPKAPAADGFETAPRSFLISSSPWQPLLALNILPERPSRLLTVGYNPGVHFLMSDG